MRILVADADHFTLKQMKKILTEEGYDVETVTTGEEAIEMIKKGEFELIILGVLLGDDMDGFTVLREIRKTLKKEIPVMAIGRRDQGEELNDMRSVGAKEFMFKPIDEKTLLQRIKKLVGTVEKKVEAKKYDEIVKKAREYLEEEIKTGTEIIVKVTEDELIAYGYIKQIGNKFEITVEDLKRALEEKGVILIDEDILKDIVEKRRVNEPLIFAKAILPEIAESAVEFRFDIKKEGFEFEKVKAGTVLCKHITRGEVKAGRTVRGKVLTAPAPHMAAMPQPGENVYYSEKKGELIAEVDGEIYYDGKKINVFPIEEIAQDLKPSMGEVTSEGTLHLKGNIHANVRIKAKGSVLCNGCCDAAEIKAGGKVFIQGGFFGRGKGKIESNGDVFVSKAENAEIKSKGNLYCSEKLEECRIAVEGKVQIEDGMIIGGVIKAAEIIAKNIGTPFETPTEIILTGKGILTEIEEALNELKKEKKPELRGIQTHLENIKSKLSQKMPCRIVCKGNLYPGVVIKYFGEELKVDNVLTNCEIKVEEGRLKIVKGAK